MTNRLRVSIVLSALALAVYQGFFVFQPVAIPKPSESLFWWGISSAVASAFWFFVFAPAWLPAVAPPRWQRLSAALLAICGAVQVGIGCLLALYGALLPLPNYFAAYGLLAVAVGIFFLYTLIRRARAASHASSGGARSQNAA